MNIEPKTFHSNGKLLLTGEYVVLDGAIALAVPTKLGQSLRVESIEKLKISWRSFDENEKVWFKDDFSIEADEVLSPNGDTDISKRLIQILTAAKHLNPNFLTEKQGYFITTQLDFPKEWGLGTSSTLINNIANWANVNPYSLLAKTFGGSGYDIGCAQHNVPITYQLKSTTPNIQEVNFNPSFKENLYFVYLNKKQNSREGIAHYKSNKNDISKEISSISDITLKMIECRELTDFQSLIRTHEQLISSIIHQKPIKEALFSDFEGSIKSLGAWGGDFVLVATEKNPIDYFKSKGFDTILSYQNLIK